MPSGSPEAKQFDLLMLQMELVLLRGEPGFDKLQENVREIARLPETQNAISMVAAKLSLIQRIQSDLLWEDVNLANLETVRNGLRKLVQFIERQKRSTVITDFADEVGNTALIDLPGTAVGVDPEHVRAKALAFLRRYVEVPVIHKLKFNEPLGADDLAALEAIFIAEGTSREEIEAAKKQSEGLGLIVRSLVGLDRQAAKAALSQFVNGKTLTANQIEFTNLVVNRLESQGWARYG